ncbi:MAG: hypothetical protein U1E22_00005, partial [Coriobacteriia bacterium]|nr:hypothetical protein [Coriobacteriia bacterium]
MDWRELLGGVGAVTGVVSLSWLILKDALAWGRRPRLVVEAFDPDTDIRSFGATEGRRRRYVHLHVHNDGRMTAKRVVAKLTHVSGPRGESFLDRS